MSALIVAVMVAASGATLVSSPLVFTVATLALDVVQIAEFVTFAYVPSLLLPVTVSCCVELTVRFPVLGATEIDLNVFAWLLSRTAQ